MITPSYVEAAISVDNIKIAQFIYLIVNNPEIRNVIDTIGRKGVRLLGRCTLTAANADGRELRAVNKKVTRRSCVIASTLRSYAGGINPAASSGVQWNYRLSLMKRAITNA